MGSDSWLVTSILIIFFKKAGIGRKRPEIAGIDGSGR
jgi:hypothetical protein